MQSLLAWRSLCRPDWPWTWIDLCSVFRLRAYLCVPAWLECQVISVKLHSCMLRETGGGRAFWLPTGLKSLTDKIRCNSIVLWWLLINVWRSAHVIVSAHTSPERCYFNRRGKASKSGHPCTLCRRVRWLSVLLFMISNIHCIWQISNEYTISWKANLKSWKVTKYN